MPFIKCTMIFNFPTNVSKPNATAHRLAGWSESFYDADPITKTIVDFNYLCSKRANLLPKGAAIVGQRYQQVNPVGRSQTGSIPFAGGALKADVPNATLLVRLPAAGALNFRPTYIRGIPDDEVIEGEYSPGIDFQIAMSTFLANLEGYYFRGRDLSQVAHPLLTIAADGELSFEDGFTATIGSMYRVLRTTQVSSGNEFGGRFKAVLLTSGKTGLFNWPHGACKNGSLRLDQTTYIQIGAGGSETGRIVSRKVGRPPGQYRGRVSTRR